MNTQDRFSQSIVRRSAMLFSLVIPGMLLNLLLPYFAANLLESAEFGIFYLSVSLVNTFFAPAVILNLFFSRYFIEALQLKGPGGALAAYHDVVRAITAWGGLVALVLLGVLILLGMLARVESLQVIVIVVLITYTSYIADTVRAVLQGLHRFFWLGSYTFAWMALRFALGLGGLYLAGTVSGGLTGVLASAPLVFLAAYFLLTRSGEGYSGGGETFSGRHFAPLLPMMLSYGLFIVITYQDVLLAYFLLEKDGLGLYAGSSVLPKAIIVATMPILQIMFPLMLHHGEQSELKLVMLIKGLGVTVLAAGGAMVVLFWGSALFCGGRFGIQLCHPGLLLPMVLSAMPLCLLRVLVITQFTRRLDWHPLLLMFPALAFFVYGFSVQPDAIDLAETFAIFSFVLLSLYILVCLSYPAAWGRGYHRMLASWYKAK